MGSKKALISGVTGQVGSYLVELLLEKDYEVHGLVRKSSTFSTERIDHLIGGHPTALYSERLKLHYYDLADPLPIVRLLDQVEPDEIYNLAAQSHVQVSFEQPVATGLHTGLSTATILEAIRVSGSKARFYQASSSEIYGNEPAPQGLHTPISPRSPYAAAKAYAYHMTKIYREAYGMFAVNGILFNTESPRRSPTFVTRKITQAIARIITKGQKKLTLGNLDARRDWSYAGDNVVAIYKMMQRATPGDWVVASGESHSVREFLTVALIHAYDFDRSSDGDISRWIDTWCMEHLVIDERYRRPLEVDHLRGDARLTRSSLDWKPTMSFYDLVKLMVDEDLSIERRLRT